MTRRFGGPPLPGDRLLVTALAAAVFLAAWGLVHRWFWAHGQLVDTPTYQRFGDAMVKHGEVPYRDFEVEYPPGALPAFALPSFFGDYASAFAWLMAACGVGLVAVVASVHRSAAFYVALSPVLVGSLVLSRFDLWPALLATAAVAALAVERHRLGWALLGAAFVAKGWPLVLVPPALVWSYRRGRASAAWAGVAVTFVVLLPFAILAARGLAHSYRGQVSRPLQIESLGASLLTTFGKPTVITSHGSQNLAGHGLLSALIAILELAALVALWIGFARGPASAERLFRYSAACVCAFVALDKVLSPQFLVWLVPLVPLVRGRRGLLATGLLTAALVLTQVWFPRSYFRYANQLQLAGFVLARNLVLVALLCVLALPAARRSRIDPNGAA